MSKMKAIVMSGYGAPEVLRVAEVEKPTPKDGEVLVRVEATTVNYGDLAARNFPAITPAEFNMPLLLWFLARQFFGTKTPNRPILGSVFSGVVDSAGAGVTGFKSGDEVFGYVGQNLGAYAEYLALPATGCIGGKPAKVGHGEAAVLAYGGIMAVGLMKAAHIQPGHRVAIVGASGGIGSVAAQIAKQKGAVVTGVCGTPRVDFVKALGADRVVDYTKEGFASAGVTYDVIFDVLGRSSFADARKALAPKGRYVRASFKSRELFQMVLTSITVGQRVICVLAPESPANRAEAARLIDEGFLRAIVDRTFPMEEAAAAHRYVEDGLAKGSVVIQLRSAPQ